MDWILHVEPDEFVHVNADVTGPVIVEPAAEAENPPAAVIDNREYPVPVISVPGAAAVAAVESSRMTIGFVSVGTELVFRVVEFRIWETSA
jgi:hypothetical protein